MEKQFAARYGVARLKVVTKHAMLAEICAFSSLRSPYRRSERRQGFAHKIDSSDYFASVFRFGLLAPAVERISSWQHAIVAAGTNPT
jgi:hypothetical protein